MSSSAVTPGSVVVRPARAGDIPGITRIYAAAVLHGTATFDVVPPADATMAQKLNELAAGGFPYLVAERDGGLAGYAYAGPFRLREAYASTVEDSVYIAEDARGIGVGKLLLRELVSACTALGFRSMLALIGDSGSAASIGLHRACHFDPAGVLRGVGYKHGRWLDVVLMERALGPGTSASPTR